MKLIWRTDVHLSDKAPQSRKDDWVETVFGKLEQVRRVAAQLGAAAVLDGGDFFHIKSPSRNSHDLVRRTAEHHAGYPCPVYCTPGNHDSVYGDYGFLNQQPLGVLFSSGVFRRLYDEYEVFFGPVDRLTPTVKAYPYKNGWVNGNPFTLSNPQVPVVRVVGIPYHGVKYDMARAEGIKKGAEDFLVCIAHVLASSKGGTMFEGEDIWKYSDLAPLDPDLWLFGHWHKDQGVEEINGKRFVNVGSLTRGALTQDETARRPACVLLTFEKGKLPQVQVIRLRVGDPEQVFDMDGRIRAEAREMTMTTFVESLRETLGELSEKDLDEQIASMTVPDSVRERALHYLENA